MAPIVAVAAAAARVAPCTSSQARSYFRVDLTSNLKAWFKDGEAMPGKTTQERQDKWRLVKGAIDELMKDALGADQRKSERAIEVARACFEDMHSPLPKTDAIKSVIGIIMPGTKDDIFSQEEQDSLPW